MWCPEGLFSYNVFGRSATDGHDQDRKKLCIAERRTVRDGVKDGMFGLDILFTNGSIIKNDLAPSTTKAWKREQDYTKVKFCQEWTKALLEKVTGTRKRFAAGMQQTATDFDFGMLSSPQHQHRQRQVAEHRLVDMTDVAREKDGHTRNVLRGPCAYTECSLDASQRKNHAHFRCNQCEAASGRLGAYFHATCWGEQHVCNKK